jgi:hypothetical protein
MKPEGRPVGQRQTVWRPRPGGAPTVHRCFRCLASWDIKRWITPGHGAGQSQGVEHAEPKGGVIPNAIEIRESTRQLRTKVLPLLPQPGMPTRQRASGGGWAGGCGRGGGGRRGGCGGYGGRGRIKRGAQTDLLELPVVPAPWCDAFRQARARVATGGTAEAQDRHRVAVRFSPIAQIRFARVVAMCPKHVGATVGAVRRSIHLRGQVNGFLVLIELGDAGYNSLHRLGAFCQGWSG